MKRSQHRLPLTRGRPAYPSDLTDEQWAMLEPLVPALSPEAASHVHERREIVNAMLSVLRSGCAWRMLPYEFPAWAMVSSPFRTGPREVIWDHLLRALRRFATHMAEILSQAPRSSTVHPSQPVRFAVPKRAMIWARNLRLQASCTR